MDYPTFSNVFLNHRGLISDKWLNYLDIYEQYLKKYIGKHINTLEIGVQNGGSIQIMNKYLINAHVHGVDINPTVLSLGLEEEATIYCFDATNTIEIEKHLSDKKFEVIIDDGSHENRDIICSFRALFPKLQPGGVYIIEDIQTSYWKVSPGGGVKNPNSAISFFSVFIDLINFFHIREKVWCDDTLKKEREIYISWLNSVQFYDNMIIITKLLEEKTAPYQRFFTGDPTQIKTLINQNNVNLQGYKTEYNR